MSITDSDAYTPVDFTTPGGVLSPSYGRTSTRPVPVLRDFVSVKDFGANPAAADNVAAIQAGIDALTATPEGGALLFPGRFGCRGQLTLKPNVDLVSWGNGGIIWGTDLGAGEPGIVTTDADQNRPYIVQLRLSGPGPGAGMDGLRIAGSCKATLQNGSSQGFHAGVVWDNSLGHITHHQFICTNNKYGIYVLDDSSDFFLYGGEINGNTVAGMATPANVGISALRVYRTHCGFQPYGFLMESGAPGNTFTPFMSDTVLDGARFESMGNGAVVCLATFDATDKVNTGDLVIRDPGYSFNSGVHNVGLSNAYLIDLGIITGLIEIEQGQFPFTVGGVGQAGSSGVIRAQQSGGIIAIRGDSALPGTALNFLTGGTQSVIQGTAPILQHSDATLNSLVISPTTTDAVIQLGGPSATNAEVDLIHGRISSDAAGIYIDTDPSGGVIRFRDAVGGYAPVLEMSGPNLGFFGHIPAGRPAFLLSGIGTTEPLARALVAALDSIGIINGTFS